SLELLGHLAGHASTPATIDLSLLHPVVQGVGRTANLLGNRNHGRPARRILPAMLQHHPHRPGPHLGGKLVRCLAHQALSYLAARASDSPGAVQITCPMTWDGAILSLGRTLADGDHIEDLSLPGSALRKPPAEAALR